MVAHTKDAHPRRRATHGKEPVTPEDGSKRAKDTDSRRRVWPVLAPIVTALISVVGTVALGYIKVLPDLQNKDSKIIEDLRQRLQQQDSNADALKAKGSTSTAKRSTISGWALDPKTKQPLGYHGVFLIPHGKYPEFEGETEPDGSFTFTDVPDQPYYIIVREPHSGSSSFGSIRKVNDVSLLDAKSLPTLLKYSVNRVNGEQ